MQQVGVIQPGPFRGDTCLVEWASGRQEECCTGKAKRFQLVHLEVSPTSGAPVVAGDAWGASGKGEQQGEGQGSAVLWCGMPVPRPADLSTAGARYGAAVERGTHWTYGGAEPGVGSIEDEVDSGKGGTSVQQGELPRPRRLQSMRV